jgi:4-diphosphocytidyl-2-C-methyl-D-erythritol kinase
MAASVRVKAAAKVNLHLRIYDRREDGFHGILSLFQAVSLADSIVIRSLKTTSSIEIDGDFDCPARQTTVFKAARAYLDDAGIRCGLAIGVEKIIPAGAGLGGGSSDAASVLFGLEALLGAGLSISRLQALGASIGSDVPFFLSSAAAIVTGRGERVRPISARDDFRLVIAFPGFPVSTAGAYALLDRERPDGSAEADPGEAELEAAYRLDPGKWIFANSFEKAITAANPRIGEAKAILLGAGASFSAMSGSGSAVFGVFGEGSRPEEAMDSLRRSGFTAYAAAPLARCMALD